MNDYNIKDWELIERYFQGQLTEEERNDFKIRQSKDADFHLEIQTFLTVQRASRAELKKKLLSQPKPMVVFLKKYSIAIAASFAFIVACIWFMTNRTKPLSTQEAFALYYEPYSSNTQVMGNNKIETSLDSAYALYEKHNYQDALRLFEKMDSLNSKSKMCQAHAYLNIGDTDKALLLFNSLQTDRNLGDKASWYLALIFLKKNDKNTALNLLNKIKDANNSSFKEKAKELLEKL